MIAKTKDPTIPTDRFEQAGAAAEEQMAFYLRRAFGDAADVVVINDLRLADGEDVAQIDHLVLHPFGLFIIESKSVSGEVEVNAHEEWIRKWSGQRTGMASPIQQAKRQGDFLRKLLNQHRESLRDKRILGYIQGGFGHCPIDVRVAISDKGIIQRRKANPPELMKADLVCDSIKQEIERHRKASGLLSRIDGDYGTWKLNPDEFQRVRDFLLVRHTPRPAPSAKPMTTSSQPTMSPSPASAPPVQPSAPKTPPVAQPSAPKMPPVAQPVAPKTQSPAPPASSSPATSPPNDAPAARPVCKHCGSAGLVGTYGKYGYYFKCAACNKNTPIDYACVACGKKGRIRKQGPQFHRVCEVCGREELIWENAGGA